MFRFMVGDNTQNNCREIQLFLPPGTDELRKQLYDVFAGFQGHVAEVVSIKGLLSDFDSSLAWGFARCCSQLGRVRQAYIREGNSDADFTPFLVIEFQDVVQKDWIHSISAIA